MKPRKDNWVPPAERAEDFVPVAAQISLYPLRQVKLAPVIDEALELLRKHPLQVVSGSMSTLVSGDEAQVFAALRQVFAMAASKGDVVMVATLSNACPPPDNE
jgi:uncharacterized protein YqgV (UPF0045/DUF77 family)